MKHVLTLLLFLLSNVLHSFCQIVYTDILPDDTLQYNETYDLDLNNDGNIDFTVRNYHINSICCSSPSYYPDISISCDTGNHVLAIASGYSKNIRELNSGNPISPSSLTWNNDTNGRVFSLILGCPMGSCQAQANGLWTLGTTGFAGLRIKVGSNYFYGWLRMLVLSTLPQTILFDYAYNSLPDAMILAGQMPVGITELTEQSSCTIFPNPLHSTATLQLPQSFSQAQLKIYNVLGEEVKRQKITSQTVEISREGMRDGIYFFRVVNEKGEGAGGKFVVE